MICVYLAVCETCVVSVCETCVSVCETCVCLSRMCCTQESSKYKRSESPILNKAIPHHYV